jgi:hypothetical protein
VYSFKETLTVTSIVIYIFIADSFVNEIFGDNMIIPTHKDVRLLFRPLFYVIFHRVVGKCSGTVSIIRRCISQHSSAADNMNHGWIRDAVMWNIIRITVA